MRIAIADDDVTFVDFIKAITGNDGHSCVVFGDGQSIVTQLQRETFDLVILDWHMPRMTGPEVLGWMQQNLEVPPAGHHADQPVQQERHRPHPQPGRG